MFMNILTVDTSSKEIAIGVFKGTKCLFEDYIIADRNYNKVLMPILQESISKSGLKLDEIDIYASTFGPGSFTGIRVGMAALKGLAQPVGKKYSGAVVLDIMANSCPSEGGIWAILDAGRGELYAAFYAATDKGIIKKLSGKYLLITKERFIKKLKRGDTIVFLNRENVMDEQLLAVPKIHPAGLEHIDMKVFAEIVASKAKDIKKEDLYTAAPLYIRPSEAEATLIRKRKENIKIKRSVNK